MTGTSPKRRRLTVAIAWVLSLVVALAIGWWAAAQATRPPSAGIPPAAPVTVDVVNGSLEVEQAYGIDASWPTRPVGVNGKDGVLTSMSLKSAGSRIRAGDILYTIDLQPVVALKGETPAFRELHQGLSGDDIRQLQEFLKSQGYLTGSVDGRYGPATRSAVNRWSKARGVPQTGTVPAGQIVFVTTLPAVLAPAKDARIGARISSGQDLIVGAQADPTFSFRVLPEAVSRTTKGLPVHINANGKTWMAAVDRLAASTDETDATIAILRPASGTSSICGADCSSAVTPGKATVLPGKLVLVPKTTGAEVPTAAIQTDVSGTTFVTLDDGERHTIETRASSDGRSIVDGLEPGQRVVVPGSVEGG